jgi:ditrans,polycis-polyprenyl diphosphate synthase
VAFAYTAREEVSAAVKKAAKAVEEGLLKPCDISEPLIERCLYTGFSPRPELLVRTSGEVRLSDFLLWQSSYSVTYFSQVLWPDFSLANLMMAIIYFQRHNRYVNDMVTSEAYNYLETADQESRVSQFLESLDS